MIRLVLRVSLIAWLAAGAARADDVEQIEQRFAATVQAGHESAGSPLSAMLSKTGLSEEDSARIARSFIEGLVACLLTAARAEADEHSVAYRDVLLAFEDALDDPDIDEPAIVDMDRVDARAEDCALDQMQQAGVSVELLVRQSTSTGD